MSALSYFLIAVQLVASPLSEVCAGLMPAVGCTSDRVQKEADGPACACCDTIQEARCCPSDPAQEQTSGKTREVQLDKNHPGLAPLGFILLTAPHGRLAAGGTPPALLTGDPASLQAQHIRLQI